MTTLLELGVVGERVDVANMISNRVQFLLQKLEIPY
jgi:hypothetical protein